MDRDVTPRIFGTLDDRVRRSLARAFAGGLSGLSASRPVSFRFYDTFDWRLYSRGLVLVHQDGIFRLRERTTGRVLAEQDLGHGPPPPFSGDWPAGDLRDRLIKAVKVRALVHLVTLEGAARALDHVDSRSGRGWRVEFLDLKVRRGGGASGFPHIVALRPVDGRDKGGKRMARRLRDAGLRPLPPTLLEAALHAARIRPAAYTSKVRVRLDPAEPSREAAIRLARRLLRIMEDNVRGMRQDVDTEFLHDYRVAMRRTRSLLSLLKKVFPPGMRDEYRGRFRALGQVTGPVRDLDVYLLRYAEYRAMLTTGHGPGLDELFALGLERRTEAFRELADRLDAGDFRRVMRDWRAALEDPAAWEQAPPRGDRPAAEVAAAVVTKNYAKVRAMGRAMGDSPTDEDLHRLRIAGKKLRYALEFFAGLWKTTEVTELVAILKKLQDLLGDHNDLTVQQRDLARLRRGRKGDGLTETALRTAEVLEKSLAERRAGLRAGFAAVFADFASKKTAKRVSKLVRSRG